MDLGDSYLAQRIIPMERVGVYVPGGRAAYPSSVLMNVIPAQIAGVKEDNKVYSSNGRRKSILYDFGYCKDYRCRS